MTKLIDITGKALSGEWGTDDLDGSGIRVLRTTNFTNDGVVDYNDVVTRKIAKKNLDSKYLRHGDIIIEKSGGSDKQPVGRVIYFEGPEQTYLFNNFTGLLRVRDRNTWLPRYVFYSLFSNYLMGGTRAYENRTTGLHNLQTDSYISSFEVRPVSIEKQVEICSNLDKIIHMISLKKKQISKLDELVKSRFVEMFSSVENEDTLVNLCTFIDYRGKTPEKTESGLPFITAKNIKMHHMSFDTQEFISKETYDKVMTRGFPRIGDVVFTTEAPLGNVCRIPYIETEFYIGQRIITMQTELLEPAYLEYALSSDDFKRKIAEKSSGSTVTGIRSKLLEQLTIPVPPRALQEQFASFVKQTDKSKLAVKQSLEKLETLKKSLMQQYFG